MNNHELVFATGNPSKLAQMRFVIKYRKLPITVIPARERFGDEAIYDEAGESPSAIAQRGALQVAARLGLPVVTEDTTLHVEALGGGPGIISGAYLLEHGRTGLLAEMEGQDNRSATISSAVVWASPNGITQTMVSNITGEIALEEAWDPELPDWIAPTEENPLGGGYNAIFKPHGSEFTLAQIPPIAALLWGYREPNFLALIDFVMAQENKSNDHGQ